MSRQVLSTMSARKRRRSDCLTVDDGMWIAGCGTTKNWKMRGSELLKLKRGTREKASG